MNQPCQKVCMLVLALSICPSNWLMEFIGYMFTQYYANKKPYKTKGSVLKSTLKQIARQSKVVLSTALSCTQQHLIEVYTHHPSSRLKLTFSCMMELNKYPLDDQVCTMEIASCECLTSLKVHSTDPQFLQAAQTVPLILI